MKRNTISAKELLTTNGRIPRSVFWAFMGGMYGLFAILGLIHENIKLPEWAEMTFGFFIFSIILTGIIVQIKRWHDLDMSGWWVLVNVIPCVGILCTTIMCGMMKGTPGRNRFGDDPLGVTPPPFPPREKTA